MFRPLHSRCARSYATSRHLSQLHCNHGAFSRARLRNLCPNWSRSQNMSTISPEKSEKEREIPKSLPEDADQPLAAKSEEDYASWASRMEHEALTEIIPLQIYLIAHLNKQKPMLPDEWPLELYWKLFTHTLSGQIPFARVQQLKDEWDKMMIEYADIEKALNTAVLEFRAGSGAGQYTIQGLGNNGVSAAVEIEKLYVRMQILHDSVNSLYRATRRDVGMPLDE
ncbi:hypothetical protein BDP27DRAFT_1334528 [Rhodocollybia butyracea]|uniref:Uncharacterized protein n=1 Tax=Rhodocollybia butyracea TaxID=206335 RepID=A0A9P5PDV6_9AGAR|nr:hypothetical protein BDP27DRAFT_1334528 [Rhodocollybia butyracea]